MKKCNGCGTEKPLTSFHKSKHHKGGVYPRCKACHRSAMQARKEKEILDQNGFAVYYLPEENYVGMTNSIKERMRKHKRAGKITLGYEIVGIYSSAVEAHLVETQLHFMGYEGFNYGNNK